jgi:Protein kinase domain
VSRVLGRGAFGVVYQGHDPKLKRDVAIKVLNRNALHSTKAVERFLREAQVVAQMHHSHIVPVHELGEHNGCHYIVSRFVPGTTLSDLVPDEGMDAVQAVGLVLQLLEALVYVHKMTVLHRDVKPANAIVDAEGQLSLMDFGLAGCVGQIEGRATQDGTVMGTPAYMPPEQARGDIHNIRETADQYSAGVVLYELLTGHVPFEGGPMIVQLHNVINTPPPPPSEFRADLDVQMEAICLKALAKAPEDRFASCRAFADALQNWQTLRDSPDPKGVAALVEPAPQPVAAAPTVSLVRKGTTLSPDVPGEESPLEELEAAGRRWQFLGVIAAAVVVLALAIWLVVGVVIKVMTTEGVLVVEVNEPNAEVFVDGKKVTVTWGDGGKKAEIRLRRGTHNVEVKKDGFTVDGKHVALKDGDRQIFEAKLDKATPGLRPAMDPRETKVGNRPKLLTGNNTAAQVRQAQEAWAKYLGREVEEEDEVASGVTMKFVLIPPGTSGWARQKVRKGDGRTGRRSTR